ncbi:MAG: Asp23/Gls24 family envelope stress response protein [Oscillospiraceae bacterium]|nr:Asp23/Gls24 family envelope stress response protein [Oscillospiraceae bacterium]
MAEYITRAEENGTIHIAEDVISAIVADAVKDVEGVGAPSQNVGEQLSGKKAVRNVRVEQVDDAIAVDVYLLARYGFSIPEVAQKVQDAVTNAVGGMTGFPVKEVNVHVGGVTFND